MKNIHLLYTDKPSRLFYLASNLHLEQGQLISPKNYQNIYITSDEEIKEGDWVLFEGNDTIRKAVDSIFTSGVNNIRIYANKKVFKIILTTDQDLIKDGVQSIDDEFLQWFVNNPSCEQIEVQKWFDGVDFLEYKIIIPKQEPMSYEEFRVNASEGLLEQFDADCLKYSEDGNSDNHFYANCKYWENKLKEEPKQNKWEKLNKELDDALEASFGTSPSNILDVFENAKLVLREHIIANKEEVARDLEQMREWSNSNKQQTLEELAKDFYSDENQLMERIAFKRGYTECKENSYSEEEVLDLLYKRDLYLLNRDEEVELELPDNWFEQNKKK